MSRLYTQIDFNNPKAMSLWATKLTALPNWHLIGTDKNPAFQNSWVNYDTTTNNAAGFYKDVWGTVHLRGVVKTGTPGAASVVFTLPLGYRPKLTQLLVGRASGDVYASINVETDGDVIVVAPAAGSTYTSLDGISFSTT